MDKTAEEFIRHIATHIEDKKCIFLLGAGVSIEAGMPGGKELAQMLARKAGWEHRDKSLQQMAQDYVTVVGPVKPLIHDQLRRRQEDPTIGPTDAHRALACMADKLDVILTTNWDGLLEKAFSQAGIRSCQVIYRDTHLPGRDPAQTTLVKLHGDTGNLDSYVVTQEDFQAFRERNPLLADYLRLCLASSTLVIIGYGQEDEDFRQIYEEALKCLKPGQDPCHVYVVNPREDIVWEQYWRDKAKERFIRMTATDFLTAVYRQVKSIVNRDEELKLGRDLVPCVQTRPVIEFCGIPGVGKSTLLKAIRREYDRMDMDILTAGINFEVPDFCEGGTAGRRLIWADIVRQLEIQARYENKDELKDQLRRKTAVTLFFDTVNQAPKDTVRWLGETYIALMEQLPNLRAVFAGRYSLRASEWEPALAQKIETHRLTPFKRFTDAQRQMTMAFIYDEALARQIYDLTMGHPGMVQRTIEWLETRKIKKLQDLDSVVEELGHFMDELLETYILKDVDDDLKPIIRQLAYYRGFFWRDVRHSPRQPLSECDAFIRDKLQPTGLLQPAAQPYPFAIDRTVRKLCLNIALFQDTDRFSTATKKIGDRYEALSADKSDNWHLYIIESLYFRANELLGRRQAKQSIDASAALLSWFGAQLQKVNDEEKLLHLQACMQKDDDLESLVKRVDHKLYHSLLQVVEDRTATLEEMRA